MHIKNILEEGELQEISVCKDFLHTTEHGARAKACANCESGVIEK
jgi:hypothetical protein